MGRWRELAVIAIGAPVMIAGLAVVAIAATWPMRLGGAAMVAGAALTFAVTGQRMRLFGWGVALLGAISVVAAQL